MEKKVLKKWVVGCLIGVMIFNFMLLGSIKEEMSVLYNILALILPIGINCLIGVVLYKYSRIFERL